MTTCEEVETVGQAVDARLVYNCVGTVPRLEPDELAELGYDIVIYPTAALMAVIHGVFTHLESLNEAGRGGISEAQRAFEDERFASLPFKSDIEASAMRQLLEFAGFPDIYRQEREYIPNEKKYDRKKAR